jgi:hypothetical protein
LNYFREKTFVILILMKSKVTAKNVTLQKQVFKSKMASFLFLELIADEIKITALERFWDIV